MPEFDPSKAYAEQEEEVYFDDGREIDLLHYVYNKSNIDEIRGSPSKVLQAIDEYGRQKKYLMNVGEDKGKIVCNLIAEVKPEVMVSLLAVHVVCCKADWGCRLSWAAMLDTPPSSSLTRYAKLAANDISVSRGALSLGPSSRHLSIWQGWETL